MLLHFTHGGQMEEIMPTGKEIHMWFNTPQNGVYMDFSFKKLLK